MTAKLALVPLVAMVVAAGQANAAPVAFSCQQDVFNKDRTPAGTQPLTFAYDGEASGTLTATTPWGAMKLPARFAGDIAGGNYGVKAGGPASLLMPDKAAIEACLAAKAKPGDLDDRDIVTLLVTGCGQSVDAGKAPVAVTVDVELSVIDGDVEAFISRTFVETSKIAGDHIEIDSFPLPRCTVAP